MTDNDWIKQLQSTMERHEEAAPEGLWQDIESRLPGHQAPRRPLVAWRRMAAAAVAALAVLGGGYLLWPSPDKATDKPIIAATIDHDEPVNDEITSPVITDATTHPHTASPKSPAPPHYSVNSINPVNSVNSVDPVDSVEPVEQQPQQPTHPVKKDEPLLASNNSQQGFMESPVKPLPLRQSPVTMGLYASNGLSNNDVGNKPIAFACDALYASYKAPKQPNTYFTEDIYKAHHHAPYSIGLSVRMPLNHHLALTSGLVYTRVKSDYNSASNTRRQTLHYIGVPLGLTCKIWDYKRLHTYAIGGMQADFNVKATLTQNGDANKLTIGKDRVQFSAMLGPGVEFDVVPGLGIYIEPTARYYIDNGSDLQNYFKDKPLNINFNAGLRICLQ